MMNSSLLKWPGQGAVVFSFATNNVQTANVERKSVEILMEVASMAEKNTKVKQSHVPICSNLDPSYNV